MELEDEGQDELHRDEVSRQSADAEGATPTAEPIETGPIACEDDEILEELRRLEAEVEAEDQWLATLSPEEQMAYLRSKYGDEWLDTPASEGSEEPAADANPPDAPPASECAQALPQEALAVHTAQPRENQSVSENVKHFETPAGRIY